MKRQLALLPLLATLLLVPSTLRAEPSSSLGETTPRVLLVGDSWAQFMWFDRSLRDVFAANGRPDIVEVGAVTAQGGTTAAEWTDPAMLQMITDELQANPTIDVVQLTIGGNDAQLWDARAQQPIVSFSPHGAVSSAALSPDGRLAATGSWDNSIKLWDAQTGRSVRKLENAHQGYVNSVMFAPLSSNELLSASDDGTAILWRLGEANRPVRSFAGHRGRVMQAVFSSDGELVLTAGADRTARLWDRDGRARQTFDGHAWAVLSCAISNDQQRVLTGSQDNTAIVWSVATGKPIAKLSGHTAPVTSVAFSADGTRVLTGSQDRTAKLWDARSGKEILTLNGHTREVTSVAFSPDGRSVLTASRDGAAMLWLAEPWAAQPAALVGR